MSDLDLGDQAPYRLSVAIKGFHSAMDRLGTHSKNTDIDDVFVTITEALWWAQSIDEGMERLVGRDEYRPARKADPDGAVLDGIRFARNRAGHERALVIARRSRSGLPSTIPAGLPTGDFEIVWRPLAQMPVGTKPDREGERSYTQLLAGTPASSSLRFAASWFTKAQATWPEVVMPPPAPPSQDY